VDTLGYQSLVQERLAASGYALQVTPPWGLVGYRRDFRMRWMATTLHLLVHVTTAPHVTADGLHQFTHAALDDAKARRGEMRGLQSGVAVITVVIGDSADRGAHDYARGTIVKEFAAFAWPTVVDLGAQVRSSHAGRPMIGAAYTSWMRQQIETLLPQPGTLQPSGGR
jgi:hypothetical protein